MKKYFLLFVLAFSFFLSQAQKEGTARLYGYTQPVLPGANNSVIEEGGEQTSGDTKPGKNYKIYIQSSSRVYPVEMWINGTPYSVKMEIITNTPVIHGNEASGNRRVLVPKTAQKVLLLTPSPYTETKNAGDVSSIAKNNELVILYRQNGKFYYNRLAKLEQLEAAAMQ